MTSPATPKSSAESRRNTRKTLRTLSYIVTAQRTEPIDCTVVDLSATGAKISLGAGAQRKAFAAAFDIPAEFCLQIPRDNIAVDCKLAWQADNMIGASFLSAFRPLKAPSLKPKPAAEGALRKPATGLRKVK